MQRQPHMCMEAIACWISAKPQCLGRAIGDWCFSDISLINPKNVYVVSHATLPSETEMRPAVQCEPWTRIWMHHFHWVACPQGIVALLSFQYPALLFSIGSSRLFPSRAGSNKKPIRFVSLHWGNGSVCFWILHGFTITKKNSSWNSKAHGIQRHSANNFTSWEEFAQHHGLFEFATAHHQSHHWQITDHSATCNVLIVTKKGVHFGGRFAHLIRAQKGLPNPRFGTKLGTY